MRLPPNFRPSFISGSSAPPLLIRQLYHLLIMIEKRFPLPNDFSASQISNRNLQEAISIVEALIANEAYWEQFPEYFSLSQKETEDALRGVETGHKIKKSYNIDLFGLQEVPEADEARVLRYATAEQPKAELRGALAIWLQRVREGQ